MEMSESGDRILWSYFSKNSLKSITSSIYWDSSPYPFFTESALLADSVIELPCPSVCLFTPSDVVFFFRPFIGPEMIWSVPRPIIVPPFLPPSFLGNLKNSETDKLQNFETPSSFFGGRGGETYFRPSPKEKRKKRNIVFWREKN